MDAAAPAPVWLSVDRLAAYGEPVEGTPFGRYRLIELLGRGGMGEVWRAHDTVTDRVVAIKVLTSDLSEDDDFQRRFRREAHAAARLDTPHVVPIHDYGEIDGRLFVSMRLIKGRDLDDVLADGPLEPARAVRIIEQVAKALHAAHKVGLIHRDIKPSNILLDDDDFAYLIDFGIARVADDTRLTKTGNTIGTFAYIAPERLNGRAEDARADIYSLACVLYEALTGQPPFTGDNMGRLVAAHLNDPPPRPSATQPEVPATIDEVIATGMAKDPDQRYATTVELADAARNALTEPIQRPTPTATQPTAEQAPSPVPRPAPAYDQRRQPPLSPWAPAAAQLRPESTAYHAPQFASPAPQDQRTLSPMPLSPAQPIPTKAGRVSRRTTIALIAGAIALVAVIAAAVGLPALIKQRPSGSSPTPPTSSQRTYAAQVVLPFTGLNGPYGLAVDSAGSLYVADNGNNRVQKLPAGSATQEVLPFTDLNSPEGVAVDSTGVVYVTDAGNNRVVKLAAGSSGQEVLPFTSRLNLPDGVAVDAAGNVYVAELLQNLVLKLAAGSSSEEPLRFTGLYYAAGVAVDAAGTLYVTDSTDNNNDRVLKLPAGSATQEELPFTGLRKPVGVAVDATGSVYVIDQDNNRVVKLAAGSSTQVVLPFTGLNHPCGVAVDTAGNVYVTDQNNRVVKLPML